MLTERFFRAPGPRTKYFESIFGHLINCRHCNLLLIIKTTSYLEKFYENDKTAYLNKNFCVFVVLLYNKNSFI